MGKKTGFFYFREIFGIILSVATLGTAAPIIVNVYIDNPKIFNDLETSCSLKGTFALFCLAFVVEVFLCLLKGSCFALAIICRGRCKINCYHVIVLLHFTSCTFLSVGILIYAVKLNANVWYWNMATVSSFLAMLNSFVTCIFQREYRGLRKEDSNTNKLIKEIGNY
eukprot:XP_019918426.1 PREDICTED: uncharacterized protein LOC105317443 [Crassostrea gigas]